MKRFYREATAVPTALGWAIELDGRPVKTQGGRPLVVPGQAAARMLAGEWNAQGEDIDPHTLRGRDLVDYAIDVVAADTAAATAALLRFVETDTLCYRADPDEALWKHQQEVWEPLLQACEVREGVTLRRVSGVMPRPQDPVALATLRQRLETFDPFTLAALTALASLAASLVIALAALEPGADGAALWRAANLEEDWQTDLWGRDPEAQVRRDKREGDFLAAVALLSALRGD